MLVVERHSEAARRVFGSASAPALVSGLAVAEVASALSLKTRKRELTRSEAAALLADFDGLVTAQCEAVLTSANDVADANLIVRQFDHELRAPDAIHIASALRLKATLATLDKGMAEAARALGLEVVGVQPTA